MTEGDREERARAGRSEPTAHATGASLSRGWRYGRWEGGDELGRLDGRDVLTAVADDLLYHGDVDAALRRLLHQGLATSSGRRVAGLRSLVERIDARRARLASSGNLSGLYDEARRRLDDVVDTERAELERMAHEPGATARRAGEQLAELGLLPEGLVERVATLTGHDFASGRAREAFDELLDDLRRDLVQVQLDRAAGALASSSAQDRAHLRDGMAALSAMLEQREAGEPIDPSFGELMERFGDVFPGAAGNLDELLGQIARQMASASSLVASMSAEQRAELAALSEALMADDGLVRELERLGRGLRAVLPSLGWDRAVAMSGEVQLDFPGAGEVFTEIAELDRLAATLKTLTQPAELAELDPAELARLLGPDAAEVLETLATLTRRLEEDGLVGRKEGRLAMTPRGLRRLGERALDELFARVRRDRVGEHRAEVSGIGHDRSDETKLYEHGDLLRLDVERTLRNALLRVSTAGGPAALQLPIRLKEEDFEVERSEHLSAASTVLALDLSLSMPIRENFLAAKKVALALQSLIASRYPRDFLGLVGFSATARVIAAEELPALSWDFAYGTNLQHALALARSLLRHKSGAKQLVVVTDGEPTAHVLEGGDVFFDYPPTPETIAATLAEVARCTRAGITIDIFVLDATGDLRAFVEQMTRVNRGRAFFTTPEELGRYLLVDFVELRSGRSRRVAHR